MSADSHSKSDLTVHSLTLRTPSGKTALINLEVGSVHVTGRYVYDGLIEYLKKQGEVIDSYSTLEIYKYNSGRGELLYDDDTILDMKPIQNGNTKLVYNYIQSPGQTEKIHRNKQIIASETMYNVAFFSPQYMGGRKVLVALKGPTHKGSAIYKKLAEVTGIDEEKLSIVYSEYEILRRDYVVDLKSWKYLIPRLFMVL